MGVNISCDHCEKHIVGVSTSSLGVENDYDLGVCVKFSTGRSSNISDGAVNLEHVPQYGLRIFCRDCKEAYNKAYNELLRKYA